MRRRSLINVLLASTIVATAMNTARIVALAARILGTAMLAFLLLLFVGVLAGDSSETDGLPLRDTKELIAFLLFPASTIIGLSLAYRWPLLGGLIVVGSTILLVILRPDHVQITFLLMVTPGLLYVAHGLHLRRRVA